MKNCKVKGHMRNGKKVKSHSRLTKQEVAKYGTGAKKKAMKNRMEKGDGDGWWNDPDLQY